MGWTVEIQHLRLAAKKAEDLSTPDTTIELVIRTDHVLVRGERRKNEGRFSYTSISVWGDLALAMEPVLVIAVEQVAEKLRNIE